MRNLIRTLRKNFWGVFDVQTDPTTGRQKVWIPLTESFVDSVVKNIDLDTKDINFRAKHPKAYGLTAVVRSLVKNALDKMNFGEYLDEFEKTLAIDGTAVWKTIESKDDDGKCVEILPVDLLNIYIDPTARSIQEAYRFTERSLMDVDDVRGMSGWLNTKDVQGSVGLPRSDATFNMQAFSTSKYVDVYELWGKIPKSLITGNADDKEEVDGHIIASGLDRAGQEHIHLVETYSGLKPYEEAWYSRVPGRWYGRGVAEKLLMLQLWVNTVVNIRINRAMVSQLGLFKIRKGSGVTPQMLSRLSANGAIVVNNMDDLEQVAMTEASQASYKDEDVILNWARQTTSNYEAVTGETLPASTTATIGSLQARSASSQFVLIKEQIGMFLQRWVKNQALPILISNLKPSTLVRMGLDADALTDWDSNLVNQELYAQLDAIGDAGLFVDPMQIEQERLRALASLTAQGKDRFVELLTTFNPTDYDTEVFITNEEFDKGVMVTNLTTQLQTLPALAGTGLDIPSLVTNIMRESWDLMGLDATQIKAPQQTMQPQQAGVAGAPPPGAPPVATQQNVMTSANTMEPNARP